MDVTLAPHVRAAPPALRAWAAAQEDGCAAADADGTAAGASPAAPVTPSPSAVDLFSAGPDCLARAARWAVAFTNAREGPLPGGLRLRVASSHPDDVRAMHAFVVELAVFEREPEAVITTPATFLRDGFGPSRQFHVIFVEAPKEGVCEEDGNSTPLPWSDHVPVAMALAHASYSTWQGPSIYVEDVYVSPVFRRRGIGERLFLCWARAAAAARVARLQWTALDWNENAIALYAGKLKASVLSEWTLFRLYRGDIERVALGEGGPSQ